MEDAYTILQIANKIGISEQPSINGWENWNNRNF
jgi:hypothetical protein